MNNPVRILIADDDAGVRGLLDALFRREGWIVTMAADGDAAVEQIALASPDIVILDLMLPKRSGVEVLQDPIVRRYPTDKRVILLTAVSEAHLRRLPPDLPVWQVIRKPFDNDELVTRARECVSRIERRQPPASVTL